LEGHLLGGASPQSTPQSPSMKVRCKVRLVSIIIRVNEKSETLEECNFQNYDSRKFFLHHIRSQLVKIRVSKKKKFNKNVG